MALMTSGHLSSQFGNGGLVACGAEGKGQGDNGADQLINSHVFFAKKPGEIDAIKKSDQPAYKTRYGQDQGSGDERAFGKFLDFYESSIHVCVPYRLEDLFLENYTQKCLLKEQGKECYTRRQA